MKTTIENMEIALNLANEELTYVNLPQANTIMRTYTNLTNKAISSTHVTDEQEVLSKNLHDQMSKLDALEVLSGKTIKELLNNRDYKAANDVLKVDKRIEFAKQTLWSLIDEVEGN